MDYPRRSRLPQATDRLPLGKGLQVSPFCLGIVKDPDTVLEAFDRGINFFFLTGDLHWPLYEGLRKGLERLFARGGGIRDEVVVCNVSYVTQPRFFMGPFKETLQTVKGLDRLDVVVAGGVYAEDFPFRQKAMEQLLVDGSYGCKAQGLSFHERESLRLALREDATDLAFLRYNPLHPKAQQEVFPYLEGPRRGLCYGFKSSVGRQKPELLEAVGLGDYWMPRVVDYYRFALAPKAMDGLLFAPATPQELREALDAMEEGPLDPDEEEQLLSLGGPEMTALLEAAQRLSEAQGLVSEEAAS